MIFPYLKGERQWGKVYYYRQIEWEFSQALPYIIVPLVIPQFTDLIVLLLIRGWSRLRASHINDGWDWYKLMCSHYRAIMEHSCGVMAPKTMRDECVSYLIYQHHLYLQTLNHGVDEHSSASN